MVRNTHSLPLDRLCEYTADILKPRYKGLDDEAIQELLSFPTLFAYELRNGQPARVGRVTRIVRPSGPDLRFQFNLVEDAAPIPPERILELAWDLDISEWEMNRTHWAVKDADLLKVLLDAGLISADLTAGEFAGQTGPEVPSSVSLPITPTVFTIPTVPRDTSLVAVMMPYSREFDQVYETIQASCKSVGLVCERADNIWEESTIIQDIFNLIFRSRIVIADLSGYNPNVLYEVGIAHTLGRPVVPIAQASAKPPFDLAHHRTLVYLANEQGLTEMRKKLERRLRYLGS